MNLENILEMPQVTVEGDELEPSVRAKSKAVAEIIFKLMSKRPLWSYKLRGSVLKIYEAGELLGKVGILFTEYRIASPRIGAKMQRARKFISTSSEDRVIQTVIKNFYPKTATEVLDDARFVHSIMECDEPWLVNANAYFSALVNKVEECMAKDILAFKPYIEDSFSFTDDQLLAYAEEKRRVNKLKYLSRNGSSEGYRVVEMANNKLAIHNHATDAMYFADEIPSPLKAKYGMLKMGEYDHFYMDVGIKTKSTSEGAQQTTYYIQETSDE